jgi:hypothetical protein
MRSAALVVVAAASVAAARPLTPVEGARLQHCKEPCTFSVKLPPGESLKLPAQEGAVTVSTVGVTLEVPPPWKFAVERGRDGDLVQVGSDSGLPSQNASFVSLTVRPLGKDEALASVVELRELARGIGAQDGEISEVKWGDQTWVVREVDSDAKRIRWFGFAARGRSSYTLTAWVRRGDADKMRRLLASIRLL